MKITLRQLEIFLIIAKIENMSRAAELLYLSQSACSMALTNLEEQLSGQLFDRHNKRLVLNDRGKILLSQATSIIDQVNEITRQMQSENIQELAGQLTISASTTIGNYLLPQMIANFMRLHPQTKINLKITNTQKVLQQLINFDIDLGFIEGSNPHAELETSIWRQDELVIIAAADHPLASKKRISRKDLQEEKWIMREAGSGTREKFEQAMGGNISSFLELGHSEAIKQAVIAGIGISCLSKAVVAKSLDRREITVIKTPFLALQRNFYRVIHQQKYPTSLLREFIKFTDSG